MLPFWPISTSISLRRQKCVIHNSSALFSVSECRFCGMRVGVCAPGKLAWGVLPRSCRAFGGKVASLALTAQNRS